jgi:hypothetical protein
MQKLAVYKETDPDMAMIAASELFRKGAANTSAPDTMEIKIVDIQKKVVTITRYDVSMALFSITGNKKVRNLAEAMAPQILKANLACAERSPFANLKGDLANRINKKLLAKEKPLLTRKEEICCFTYAQWIPNLDELPSSDRLRGLLEEDLLQRRKTGKNERPKAQNQPRKKS